MRLFGKTTALLMPLTFAASTAALANTKPSEGLQIKEIIYNGSGCPIGSVAENVSAAKDAFTLTFSEFYAEVYEGSRPSEQTKNCILTLVLDVPRGWQFSIADFYYRGFMDLDPYVNATHSTTYFFQGQGRQGSFESLKEGRNYGFNGEYVYRDRIGLESNVWSVCNVERSLNINTRIRVDNTRKNSNPAAQGYIANDSIDGKIVQKFGITWRRCS